MKQPEGFEVGGSDYVCKLQKSLYGLKQAGRVWNKLLHSVLSSRDFSAHSQIMGSTFITKTRSRFSCQSLLMISHLLARTPPYSTPSSKSSPLTSSFVIWVQPLSSLAWKFTGIALIGLSVSPRINSSLVCFQSMACRILSLYPLPSIRELAFPPPCVLRMMQKPQKCSNTLISLLLAP